MNTCQDFNENPKKSQRELGENSDETSPRTKDDPKNT